MVMEFDNVETIKRAVDIDAGVALLPEPTVAREVAAGSLVAVPLTTDELVRPIGIIYRHGKELSPTALRFIDLLRGEDTPADSAAGSWSGNGRAGRKSRNGASRDFRSSQPAK